MFTGIIETQGMLKEISDKGSNKSFRIESPISKELKPDQSLAHNGVCLTVEEINGDSYKVTAVQETLLKSNLGSLKPGDSVNLERSMLMNGRLDGHIVQGHVDTTAVCVQREEKDGSWNYRFRFPVEFSKLVIEKGSVCLNGISLTVFDVSEGSFSVAIIPYTYHHTNIGGVRIGSVVNIEFDVIGKYVSRLMMAQ